MSLPSLTRSVRSVHSATKHASTPRKAHAPTARGPSAQRSRPAAMDLSSKERLIKTAERVNRAAAEGGRWSGWRPKKDRGVGQEKQLRDRLEVKRVTPTQRVYPPSLLEEEILGENMVAASDIAEMGPGSFIEFRRNDTVHGVVLRVERVGRTRMASTLSLAGEVHFHLLTDIMFAIPSFIDPSLASRCGEATSPTTDDEKQSRIAVIKRLRKLDAVINRETLSIESKAARIYDHFKPANPDDTVAITTTQAASFIVGEGKPIPLITKFVIHKYLLDKSLYFEADISNIITSQAFTTRPESEIQQLKAVERWIRQGGPQLDRFAEKARTIIDQYRKLQQESIGSSPSLADTSQTTPSFDENDIAIIQFVILGHYRKRMVQANPYSNLLPALIKKISRYNCEIDQALCFRFLQEIGVYTPWEDPGIRSYGRGLPMGRVGESEVEVKMDQTARSFISQKSPIEFTDGLESVRHDFGQLPVYTIDNADAHEIDDGLSVERTADGTWLHVHIADPTSIIQLGNTLADIARHRVQTIYSTTRTWPMLPTLLTQSTFSLGAPIAKERGQPAMTFSFKMGDNGDICDYQVRASIVRNVHILRYDDVDRALGLEPTSASYPFRSKNEPAPRVDPIPIPTHAMGDLQDLSTFAKRLQQRRLQNPIIFWAFEQCNAEVVPDNLPFNPSKFTGPTLYTGFPRIEYSVTSGILTTANRIVEEFMIAAGRVAARFSAEKGVPQLYRAAESHTGPEKELAALVESRDKSNGLVDPYAALRAGIVTPPAMYHLTPTPHHPIGIMDDGYCRVTSPLRRYPDMISHWQIKEALRPTAFKRQHSYRYNQLLQIAPVLQQIESQNRKAQKISNLYWAMKRIEQQLVRPKLIDGKDPLRGIIAKVAGPSTWDYVQHAMMVDVFVPSLGLPGTLPVPKERLADFGSQHTVNVKEAVLGYNPKLLLQLAS